MTNRTCKIGKKARAARRIADELATDPQSTATAQGYIGKLQSEKERELVFMIYRDLLHLRIGNNFWHRLQTAAMIRQRHAHFRADVLTQVTEEREQAQIALKRKKTVMQKLMEHELELLDLSAKGKTSKEISAIMHRNHRSQFPAHGSPHYKTVQLALQKLRQQ